MADESTGGKQTLNSRSVFTTFEGLVSIDVVDTKFNGSNALPALELHFFRPTPRRCCISLHPRPCGLGATTDDFVTSAAQRDIVSPSDGEVVVITFVVCIEQEDPLEFEALRTMDSGHHNVLRGICQQCRRDAVSTDDTPDPREIEIVRKLRPTFGFLEQIPCIDRVNHRRILQCSNNILTAVHVSRKLPSKLCNPCPSAVLLCSTPQCMTDVQGGELLGHAQSVPVGLRQDRGASSSAVNISEPRRGIDAFQPGNEGINLFTCSRSAVHLTEARP